MFYATHNCGQKGIFRTNLDAGIIQYDAGHFWWDVCYKCRQPIEMKDLMLKYPGVEIVRYSGNEPEYRCLNGHIENCTLQIDGELYVFECESSGNRGSYQQWSRTWVSKPIEVKDDGKMVVPNSHKCGSRYWNENCWFPVEPTHYFGYDTKNHFNSLSEVIEIIRKNVDEIARRAADEKYHAG